MRRNLTNSETAVAHFETLLSSCKFAKKNTKHQEVYFLVKSVIIAIKVCYLLVTEESVESRRTPCKKAQFRNMLR